MSLPTSSSDIAISVRGLGKTYRIEHKVEHFTATEAMLHRLSNPFRKAPSEEVRVLDDISFDVARGDVVSIIGRNGAGKSTLFKILSRIVEPTEGEARIFGRVGSLIEVGTGFQPELTGRENIYLNGSILGMSRREITRRFDEIVDFSGVEKFLDTPVKRYSSGMYVRLAFSVAAHLETDILLVDEVLSVGDGEFKKKSFNKMSEIAKAGRTVVFVSHDLEPLEALCNKGIVLERGCLLKQGTLKEALYEYSCLFREKSGLPESLTSETVHFRSDYAFIKSIDLLDEHGASTHTVSMGSVIRIRVLMEAEPAVENPLFTVVIENTQTATTLTADWPILSMPCVAPVKLCEFICDFENVSLTPGAYKIFLVLNGEPLKFDETSKDLWFNVREAESPQDSDVQSTEMGEDSGIAESPAEVVVDALTLLDEEIARCNLEGHWKLTGGLPTEPEPYAKPYLWQWQDIRRLLWRASEVDGIEGGPLRRSVRLRLPDQPMKWTTPTIHASVQLLMPGEVAEAHRHTMGALRFVIEGRGGYTTVEGEKFAMEPGDLILTPSWTWHDHGHEGDIPTIWIDIHDFPFTDRIGGVFYQTYDQLHCGQSQQPLRNTGMETSPFVFKGRDSLAALQAKSVDGRDPTQGATIDIHGLGGASSILPTMTCRKHLIAADEKTDRLRQTANSIFHVIAGKGRTRCGSAGDDELTLEWQQGDIFVIPGWTWHDHQSAASEGAMLLSISDEPIQEYFGLHRRETAPR